MLDDHTTLHFPPSGIAELPLLFAPQVIRCVAAGPGGHPLTVLLDTGTDPSAIDLSLARRLDLRLGDFALGSDAASDAVHFTESVLPWLRLGELELRDLYGVALDLRQAPFKVDLVLGYNVLSQLTLTIDYAAGRLRLCHPDLEPPTPGPGGAVLPLRFFEHFPAFDGAALLCLSQPGQVQPVPLPLPLLTIDTGSNGALTLSPDLADLAGLRRGEAEVDEGRGFVERVTTLHGRAEALRIGPFELKAIELDAPESGRGDFGRGGRANLGNRLLARFQRMTLDYRRAICVLESSSQPS
ncbi:retropepsin-like domain-containing protein [Candidatus Chloroploca sp. M-50]|uniref:Retropepsin-like domain-containing protein n=1 Tax=Candidatus Chloroploca mongolica TaxID=2528176 RepID=A0ABS4D6A0_9CHLR|nr:retropepsin-like aspartic protease [Candidatus Chloroploca mongolica]MBP1464945.1 retropepsin-like domain-containing protein [Candidatus Chloroploca mongolica]